MKVLHIHVKKEYWNQARQKIKDEEYRLIKPYWFKRLYRKDYDFIYYWLGYSSIKRIFRWDRYDIKEITHKEFGDKPVKVYAISLRKPL